MVDGRLSTFKTTGVSRASLNTCSSFILAAALAVLAAVNAAAAESRVQHRLLFFEYGKGPNRMLELDASGKVVWEYTGVENAGDAQRLPNGNTLISCGTQKRVIEVTPDKKIAWQFTAADAPDLNIIWISSIQVLANGNLLVGNFLRGQEGKGAHAFEVTREKKIVWRWDDHGLIKSLTTVRALE